MRRGPLKLITWTIETRNRCKIKAYNQRSQQRQRNLHVTLVLQRTKMGSPWNDKWRKLKSEPSIARGMKQQLWIWQERPWTINPRARANRPYLAEMNWNTQQTSKGHNSAKSKTKETPPKKKRRRRLDECHTCKSTSKIRPQPTERPLQ